MKRYYFLLCIIQIFGSVSGMTSQLAHEASEEFAAEPLEGAELICQTCQHQAYQMSEEELLLLRSTATIQCNALSEYEKNIQCNALTKYEVKFVDSNGCSYEEEALFISGGKSYEPEYQSYQRVTYEGKDICIAMRQGDLAKELYELLAYRYHQQQKEVEEKTD